MNELEKTAESVRKFNRFYLPYFELLTQKYLNSDYSVAEARILYEIYDRKDISARDIVSNLHIDKGYLSRILKRFETKDLITRNSSKDDLRLAMLSLTEKGTELAESLIDESNSQIKKGLVNLSASEMLELTGHMSEIIRLLGGE